MITIGVGGLLGIGEKEVALKPSDFKGIVQKDGKSPFHCRGQEAEPGGCPDVHPTAQLSRRRDLGRRRLRLLVVTL
jgi:hypothetical protein